MNSRKREDFFCPFSGKLFHLAQKLIKEGEGGNGASAFMEEVAKMARLTLAIKPSAVPAPQHVQDKHYMRKHGPNAYYGQK